MKRVFLICVLLAMASLVPLSAQALVVVSTFDADLDGWTGNGDNVVFWVAQGGNPDGYLTTEDQGGDWAYVIAPAKFHGAWSKTWSVAADIIFLGSGGVAYQPVFEIASGNTVYRHQFTAGPTPIWQTYAAPLDANRWQPVSGSLSFEQVLGQVTDFRIRVDFSGSGSDVGGLDNIRLGVLVPHPARSTFNTDAEGWTGNGGNTVFWVAEGGNPDGYLTSEDVNCSWAKVVAPSKFLGPWPDTWTIAADIVFLGTGPVAYTPAFEITSGDTVFSYQFATGPTSAWHTYAAPLKSNKWQKLQGSLTFAQVLKNVMGFAIQVDYTDACDPSDFCGLDNISVGPVGSSGAVELLLLN
jgi:hypothetical protein